MKSDNQSVWGEIMIAKCDEFDMTFLNPQPHELMIRNNQAVRRLVQYKVSFVRQQPGTCSAQGSVLRALIPSLIFRAGNAYQQIPKTNSKVQNACTSFLYVTFMTTYQ